MRARPARSTLALLLACLPVAASAAGPGKLKVALTFDDLPINGWQAPGDKQSDYARDTIKVLKKHRIPPSYGFINASKLERNPDGALALKLWVEGGHPLANHTYNHLDFTKNSTEDFQREILRNEPALELLMPPEAFRGKHDWRWFRYPFLHEGDTLEKRRAVRAFLATNGYRIAQTTLDFEDYLWNGAYGRCIATKDEHAKRWLRESYIRAATEFTQLQIDLSRQVFGRDIHHVMLLHLGAFSSHILPDLFDVLKKQGFEIVTLEEAQTDPVYQIDPDFPEVRGGTHTELLMQAKNIPWPPDAPKKPRERLVSICK
jgi:peptidoglycan/xylan/chitin deacetylase (PgdA/CDA1 family)